MGDFVAAYFLKFLKMALKNTENLGHILKTYDVAIEDLEPAALAKVSMDDEEGLKRVARVAATNRSLRKHGLEPLLVHSSSSSPTASADALTTANDDNDVAPLNMSFFSPSSFFIDGISSSRGCCKLEKSMGIKKNKTSRKSNALFLQLTEEDKACAEALDIKPDDYAAIKGTFGMFMGLQLDEKAYKSTLRLCRSKAALKLRNDEGASKAYIVQKISLHAQERIRSRLLLLLSHNSKQQSITKNHAGQNP